MMMTKKAHACLLAVLSLVLATSMPARAEPFDGRIVETVRRIEAQLEARGGLAVLDTGSGVSSQYRAEERFPMASTFKVLVCAALLARADAGKEDPDRRVAVAASDLRPQRRNS